MAPSVHQYIRISGQAHERGVAYGSFAKERILKVIDEYKVLFDKEAHLPWKDAVRMAKRYEPAIRAYRPDLIDEMKGIAEGAGVPFDVTLTLNCRSEVMFAKSEAPADECSVIGVPPEASGNGKTYLAQNWDWWSIGAGTTVILEVDERPYPKALIVTEAGLVGGKGLNAAGVGVSLNAMSVKKGQIGVPLHVILRNAVQQPTVPKAIDTIAKAKRAGSACVGLASADGLVVAVEYAPSDLDILLSDGHPLCHTNHWLSPYMLSQGEATRYSFTSTFTRLDRVRRLTRAEEGHLKRKTLFRILSDHAGNPDGVCRHDDMSLPEYHRHTSLWSMVLDLDERTLWLTEGSPCSTKARSYTLK